MSTPTHSRIEKIWAALDRQRFALTEDGEIGVPEKFRENFAQTYFNDLVLHHDDGDRPPDRKRARDVIRYRWRDDSIELREHETITITDRAGIPGRRDHARVMLLEDPQASQLIRALLRLVPPSQRQLEGTLGVNLFRTFTNVVTKPHRDHEQFIIIYLLERIGGGAETYLYHPDDISAAGEPTGEPFLKHQLRPGEIIIFDDECFMHGATPLEASPDGVAMRDVLVCTVDYPQTYLDGRCRPCQRPGVRAELGDLCRVAGCDRAQGVVQHLRERVRVAG
jgi:hypothetical protein